MAIFGRRKPESFTGLKETMRPTPDADGVTRVFPSELWDDPKIGTILREAGFAPDDARNILPTAEDYIALFAAAKQRLHRFRAELAVAVSPFRILDLHAAVHGQIARHVAERVDMRAAVLHHRQHA